MNLPRWMLGVAGFMLGFTILVGDAVLIVVASAMAFGLLTVRKLARGAGMP